MKRSRIIVLVIALAAGAVAAMLASGNRTPEAPKAPEPPPPLATVDVLVAKTAPGQWASRADGASHSRN